MIEYIIVNLDKKEYLSPELFGHAASLLDFGPAGDGIMFALATLLTVDSKEIYIDIDFDVPVDTYQIISIGKNKKRCINKLFGSWAGDRVVITSNTANNKFTPIVKLGIDGELKETDIDLFNFIKNTKVYKNISEALKKALIEAKDSWLNNNSYYQSGEYNEAT